MLTKCGVFTILFLLHMASSKLLLIEIEDDNTQALNNMQGVPGPQGRNQGQIFQRGQRNQVIRPLRRVRMQRIGQRTLGQMPQSPISEGPKLLLVREKEDNATMEDIGLSNVTSHGHHHKKHAKGSKKAGKKVKAKAFRQAITPYYGGVQAAGKLNIFLYLRDFGKN